MPDLEKQIAEWRKEMLAAGVKTPGPLDELESHLRDEIAQQMELGLSERQAFEAATRRLGPAGALGEEFNKIEVIERNQMKRIAAILVALVAMVFGLSMVLPQLGQWSRTGILRSPIALCLGVTLVLVGGSAAFIGIKSYRGTRGRNWISAGIIMACGFYAMPFLLAVFGTRATDLTGLIFCGGLTAGAVLFFGSCFYFNRQLPARSAYER